VLLAPPTQGQSFFYFRNDTFLLEARRKLIARFAQTPDRLHGELEALEKRYFGDSDERANADRLEAFKERIRTAVYSDHQPMHWQSYDCDWDPDLENREEAGRPRGRITSLDRFGSLVLKDLCDALLVQYPELAGRQPGANETDSAFPMNISNETEDQQRYVESRLRVYVQRAILEDRLMKAALSESKIPCVVSGAAGSGKTSALAWLCRQVSSERPDVIVISNFAGGSANSTSFDHVIRRFFIDLRQTAELAENSTGTDRSKRSDYSARLPDDPVELLSVFRAMVDRLSSSRRLLLVLDGLNTFDDLDFSLLLNWLSQTMPAGARLLISCSTEDGRGEGLLAKLRQSGCEELTVGDLSEQEQRKIVEQVPLLWAKTLDEKHIRALLSNPATSNPLYLLVALDELRGFGSFELLADRIRRFPQDGDTITGIFKQVITRLADDFDAITVKRLLCWLATSRSGLSELEIRNLFVLAGSPAPANLYPLLRQIRSYTMRRGNLIDCYHQGLKRAIVNLYLSDRVDIEKVHRQLAVLFDADADPQGDGSFQGPVRALSELPHHLDGSGTDNESMNRLFALAGNRFPQIAFERTHDVTAATRDYLYYFRASLRAKRLDIALQLARARGRLSDLNRWLAEGYVAPLLSYVGADSPLWAEVRRTLASLPDPEERVRCITRFVKPEMPARVYAWLRSQFERDANAASDRVHDEFLLALVMNEEGCAEFVLQFAARRDVPENLVAALVKRADAILKGSSHSAQWFELKIAALAAHAEDTFVAAADAYAERPDSLGAVRGLRALHDSLPDLHDDMLPIRCTTALSHAFITHGQRELAETLARKAMTQMPGAFADDIREMIYAKEMIDAEVRLLLACAPFPAVWPEAIRCQQMLAARAGDALTVKSSTAHSRSNELAGQLRVTPWIENPKTRMKWLRDVLLEVESLVKKGVGNDFTLSLHSIFGGQSAQQLLVKPIEDAINELLPQIARITERETDMSALEEILLAGAKLHTQRDDDGGDVLKFFAGTIPVLAESSSPYVVVVAVELFLQVIADLDQVGNEAVDVLINAVERIASNPAVAPRGDFVRGLLDRVLKIWGPHSRRIKGVLATLAIRAAAKAQDSAILDALGPAIDGWLDGESAELKTTVAVKRAAILIRLDRRAEGEVILRQMGLKDQGPFRLRKVPAGARLIAAKMFLDGGALRDAEELLKDDLPQTIDLDDERAADRGLNVAACLMRTDGSLSAQARVAAVGAVRQYRENHLALGESVAAMILNRIHATQSTRFVGDLLDLAHDEMLRTDRPDSAIAARWYVAASLSVIGDSDGAQAAWSETADWETSQVEDEYLRSVAAILINFLRKEQDRALAGVDELSRQLQTTLEPGALCQRLALQVRLIGVVPDAVARRIGKDAVQRIRTLKTETRDVDDLLALLCKRIGLLQNDDLSIELSAALLAAAKRSGGAAPPRADGAADGLLELGATAARQIREECGLEHALGLVLREVARHGSPRSQPELFRGAVYHGLQHLAPKRARSFAMQALDVTSNILDAEARYSVLAALVTAMVEVPELNPDAAAAAAFRQADICFKSPSSRVAAYAAIYSDIVRAKPGAKTADEIAQRLRAQEPPENTVDRVQWISSLLGTPLADVARPVAEELWNHLDDFASSPAAFHGLEVFLRAIMRTWSAEEALSRATRCIDWVATMPAVTNEDWRGQAFEIILRAMASLHEQNRRSSQLAAVQRALEVLPESGQRHIASSLAYLDLDADAADQMISVILSTDHLNRATSINNSPNARLLEIITHLAPWPESEPNGLIAGICRHLDRVPSTPWTEKRAELATIAATCRHAGLRERLDMILQRALEDQGVANLDSRELMYLSKMPEDWWIDHATEAHPERPNRGDLVDWLEALVRYSPEMGVTGSILASQWVGGADPRGLPQLWFDIATSECQIDDTIRLRLLEALAANR
jgi:hypothetical protein